MKRIEPRPRSARFAHERLSDETRNHTYHLKREVLLQDVVGEVAAKSIMAREMLVLDLSVGTFGRASGTSKLKCQTSWLAICPNKLCFAPGMLFLHGGSYVVYAPCDSVYRSLASRLASQCGQVLSRQQSVLQNSCLASYVCCCCCC